MVCFGLKVVLRPIFLMALKEPFLTFLFLIFFDLKGQPLPLQVTVTVQPFLRFLSWNALSLNLSGKTSHVGSTAAFTSGSGDATPLQSSSMLLPRISLAAGLI